MSMTATGLRDRLTAYRPRWKRSLGTLRPFFSACPRPDSDGLVMKYSCRLNASLALGWSRS